MTDRLCYCEKPLEEHDGRCECATCPEQYKSACKQRLPDDAPMDDIGLAVSLWEACGYEVETPILDGLGCCVVSRSISEFRHYSGRASNFMVRPDLSHDLVAELIWPRLLKKDTAYDVINGREMDYRHILVRICIENHMEMLYAPAWAPVVAFLLSREAR